MHIRPLNRVAGTLLAGLFACVLCGVALRPASATPKPKLPTIYDTKADGSKQIADALATAKRDNKRVILQFGANWCIWCHRLHDLFENDSLIARKLLYEYVLVLIDVDTVDDKRHNDDVDKRYGRPTKHGLPTLVVLDADGRQLTTRETEAWEVGDQHDPAKVLAFLQKWQPKPESADEKLSSALARAEAQSKNVFLYFSAPWCSWCGRMDAFLQRDDVGKAVGAAFAVVKVDVDRMTGGKALAERFKTADKGLPFSVILDSKGKKLADSECEKGNVGYPVEPFEIDHFMKIIRDTGKKLTPTQVALIERTLKESRPKPHE